MSAWRSGGIGPEKTGAGLRGIGLIAILIAFLAVSNGLLSGSNEDTPKATDAGAKPTVLAPEALRTILPAVAPNATYVFGEDADLLEKVRGKAKADLFITGTPSDARTLGGEKRCSDALTLARKGARTFVACIPVAESTNSAAGVRYLETVTGLKARAALLDAGFDLPDR